MAVKIRLTRRGRKKLAIYDVVVADARSPRDGRFIEKIGSYNPTTNPATIDINDDKAVDWLIKGAQPTDTARRVLSYKGIMFKKHLQVGVLKGAITQEEADNKFVAWLQEKEAKISNKIQSLAKEKDAALKAKLEAEQKVNQARLEKLQSKAAEASKQAVAASAEGEPASADEASEAATEGANETQE